MATPPLLPLSAPAEAVIGLRRWNTGRNPGLARGEDFFKQARATQVLIGLNVLMFLAEIWRGGSTDMDAI